MSDNRIRLAKAIAQYYYDEYIATIDDVLQNRFSFFGQSVQFPSPAEIDWHHTIAAEDDFHLWRMKLGHMGFICPMLVAGDQRHRDAVKALLAGYREQATFGKSGCFSSYWFPYSVSHRVLAILSGYILSYPSIDRSLQQEIESFLRWNVSFVAANIEHELKNNHVERNLAALCFYYSCAEFVPPRVAASLDREVRRSIEACVLRDGFMIERSAMYQGLTAMALDVFANTPFLTKGTRQLASGTLAKALQAWATMSHPDGEIALFNDSWFGEVPPLSRVAGEHTTAPLALLPDAGYARLESDDIFVLMDAGPIGPRWNPGHGHADFLSIEADVADQRFIVDPGTFQYSTGSRRTFERSASSHNGPHCRGLEPVEYAGCFRVGRMNEAWFGPDASANHVTGHLSLPDGQDVCRSITVSPGLARITDVWEVGHDARVRLTIAGEWTLVSHTQRSVEFRMGSTSAVIEVTRGNISLPQAGEWVRRYLNSEPATILLLTPHHEAAESATLEWEIRKQAHL
ncbi:heparinase II/III family protein [Sinomonas soli]